MDRTGTQIDPIDRSIIEQLQRDGRVPYTRLGAAVGLSEAAVRQRVQRLTDAGVMQVVAVTNPLSHGKRRMAMIGVRTEGPTDDIAKTLQAMPDIDYLVITAGTFDLMAEVVVDRAGEFAVFGLSNTGHFAEDGTSWVLGRIDQALAEVLKQQSLAL